MEIKIEFNGEITPAIAQWLATSLVMLLFFGFYCFKMFTDKTRLVWYFFWTALSSLLASLVLSVPFFITRNSSLLLIAVIAGLLLIRCAQLGFAFIARDYAFRSSRIAKMFFYGYVLVWLASIPYNLWYIIENQVIRDDGAFSWEGNHLTAFFESITLISLVAVGVWLFRAGRMSSTRWRAVIFYLFSSLLITVSVITAAEQVVTQAFGDPDFQYARTLLTLGTGAVAILVAIAVELAKVVRSAR